MKLSVFICLGAFILSTTSFAVVEQNNDDDKVKIALYFESLCPGCQQFIKGALTRAVGTKVLTLINLGFLEDL